jgi:hypothetical protein
MPTKRETFVKKDSDDQETILDPAYWHLLPEEQRRKLQTELEDA